MSETGPSVRSRVARVAGAVGLAALGFSLNPAETADADNHTATATSTPTKTPTPPPTASPTPDATRTAQEAISRDLDEKIKQELERVKREEEKKAFDKELAAKQARLDALTTPTVTSTPSPTPTFDARKAELDRLDADRRKAKTGPTATPRPDEEGGTDPIPQPTAGPGGSGGSGPPDLSALSAVAWGIGGVAGVGAAVLAAKALHARRRRPRPLPAAGPVARGPEPGPVDADLPPLHGRGRV